MIKYYLFIFTFFLLGCTTSYIDFDNHDQNAGIIDVYEYVHNGQNYKSFVISNNLRDKYNNLIKIYGNKFKPKLHKDDGLTYIKTINHWVISPQYMVYLQDMIYFENKTKNK